MNIWRTIGVAAVGVALLVAPAYAGQNKTTKWRKDGFACAFNNNGTSNCRFDVKAKNRTDERGPHICYVVVNFTGVENNWESFTHQKNLAPQQWKRYRATAEQVPEGSIVDSWHGECYRVDKETRHP